MTEYRSTKSDAKRLARSVRPGDRLYVIVEIHPRHQPGRPPRYCSEYTVQRYRGVSGDPMVGTSTTVKDLLFEHGTVYDSPPKGVHNLAEPLPNVCEPVIDGRDKDRYLSRSEIDGMEKDVQRTREETGIRRGWF